MNLSFKQILSRWPAGVALAAGLSLGATALSGCVTKAQADAQARAAFLAGQQQAMREMQSTQPIDGPTVTVLGTVRRKLVPWVPGLTLARALLAAEYAGPADPQELTITRNGVETEVDLNQFLQGQDTPLEPQDVVNVR